MATAFEEAQKRQAYLRGQRKRAEAGAIEPREVTIEEREENILASPFGGFLRGLRDVPEGAAQLIVRSLEAGSPEGSQLHTAAKRERERLEDIQREAERVYREEWRRGQELGIDIGRVAGNVAATAPFAYAVPGGAAPALALRTAQGATVGGLTGALQPVDPDAESFWAEKGLKTGAGALAGAAIPPLTRAAERVIAPVSSKAVQTLREMGVVPTPGQAGGTVSKAIEERLASLPITGEAIRAGQRRALEQFNIGAINHGLRFANMRLPAGTKAGHEAIDAAGRMISQGYDDLIPKMRAAVDIPFAQDIQRIGTAADDLLVGDTLTAFNKQLVKVAKMAQGAKGSIPGKEAKKIISDLGRRSRDLMKNPDVNQRELGRLFGDLKTSFSNALQRGSTPEQAATLRGLDRAYSTNLRTEVAAARQGAQEGVFTPAQLKSAVRQLDPSMRKGAFARGQAPMQDIAEMGQEVLGRELPTSGTAERLMASGALVGGAALDPVLATTALAPALAYTPGRFGGQNLLAKLIAGRQGPAFQRAAETVRAATPALAAGGGAAVASQQ